VSTVARETGPTDAAEQDPDVARETVGPAAFIVLLPIRFYRRFLSPALGQRCRYYPTCSAYGEEAVSELGAFRGMILAAWRVLRCNPLSSGGMDPLSERTLFRNHETRTERTSR
jgi:uncharacterized protein